MHHSFFLLFAAGLLPMQVLPAAEPTTISLTDRVVVEDVIPLGINVGTNDSYWNHQLRKQLVEENFEGTLYREVLQFSGGDDFLEVWKHGRTPDDPAVYVGGQYEVVSGEGKGARGLILSVEPGTDRTFKVRLDPPVHAEEGAMLLTHLIAEGAIDSRGGVRIGEDVEFVADSAPESFGSHSVRLDSDKENAIIRVFPGAHGRIDMNDDWRLRFRHKADGTPSTVRVHTEGKGEEVSVQASEEWQWFDGMVPVRGMGPPANEDDDLNYLRFIFEPVEGRVLIDDIELVRTSDTNPTRFRDETIEAFRAANIGMIRALQGSHQTVSNTIRPRLQSVLGADSRFSLHEFYEFAEAIGAIPWFSLPSTLTREEMSGFIEYLAAPADTGWGQLRANMGHPDPWTQTLPGVVIEFGNELHNFGGFGGPDYWHDLIEAGKASPFYDPKIQFIMGHQGGALEHAPNMDGFAVGGYVGWGFTENEYDRYLSSAPELFEWAIANTMEHIIDADSGLAEDHRRAATRGIELAMYEGGFHTNFGNGPNAPRNQLVTSVGGAVIYINRMLAMLEKYGVRLQGYFATTGFGHKFKGTGAFGSEEAGFVRIFGTILNLDEGSERFRPAWLALSLVNEAMLPEMVQTQQVGDIPTLRYHGPIRNLREARNNLEVEPKSLSPIPLIKSYGFRDETRRSLILVNLDPRASHSIEIAEETLASPASVEIGQLAGKSIADHNEPDWNTGSPVAVKRIASKAFETSRTLRLPPLSLTTLRWER